MAEKNDFSQDFHLLSVSIDGEPHRRHLGSGFLYRRSAGKPMLVITAAHVIQAAQKNGNEIPLTLWICDKEEKIHPISRNFKCPEEFQYSADDSYSVCLHSKYKEGDATGDWYDIAILQLPWEDWMSGTPFVVFEKELPKEEDSLLGVGFPQSLQPGFDAKESFENPSEAEADETWENLSPEELEEHGRNLFAYSLEELNVNAEKVKLRQTVFYPLKYENIAGYGDSESHSETKAIEGFSGSGLYMKDAICGNYRNQGLLKKLPQKDPKIRKLFAVRSSEIAAAIAVYCNPGKNSVPVSVSEFDVLDVLSEMKEKYPCAGQDWQIVEKAARTGRISKESMLIEAKNGKSVRMKCREMDCGSCYNFVRGELAKYVCFTDDAQGADGNDLCYEMELRCGKLNILKKRQKIKITLLCPQKDEIYADFWGNQQRSGRKNKNRETNNVLYLWNRSGENYNEFSGPRPFTAYNTVDGEQRRGIFSIIRGQSAPQAAIVGVGKMMDSVFPGTSDVHGKKENLDKLMHEIWGE